MLLYSMFMSKCLCLLPIVFQSGCPLTYCRLDRNVPILRLWFDVELELIQDFRLNRKALYALHHLLRREQDHGWGHKLEVLIYAYWLAHDLSYREVSQVFSVPRSTIHRIVHKVAQFIWDYLYRAISFPSPANLDTVGHVFGQLSRTPILNKAVGAIDGCHIQIKPPSLHRLDYLNYKGFYSINMQAICDSSGKFLDIFVGYPGSAHDTHFKEQLFLHCKKVSSKWLFHSGWWRIPLFGNPNPPHHYLQGTGEWQSATKVQLPPVKEAFNCWKSLWHYENSLEVHTFQGPGPHVIASCGFLHNVCVDNGAILEPDQDVAGDNLDPELPLQELPDANEKPGNATRDRLAALIG